MALDRAVLLNVLMYSQKEICKIYEEADEIPCHTLIHTDF
jgi:hypothetical protein